MTALGFENVEALLRSMLIAATESTVQGALQGGMKKASAGGSSSWLPIIESMPGSPLRVLYLAEHD